MGAVYDCYVRRVAWTSILFGSPLLAQGRRRRPPPRALFYYGTLASTTLVAPQHTAPKQPLYRVVSVFYLLSTIRSVVGYGVFLCLQYVQLLVGTERHPAALEEGDKRQPLLPRPPPARPMHTTISTATILLLSRESYETINNNHNLRLLYWQSLSLKRVSRLTLNSIHREHCRY